MTSLACSRLFVSLHRFENVIGFLLIAGTLQLFCVARVCSPGRQPFAGLGGDLGSRLSGPAREGVSHRARAGAASSGRNTHARRV